MVVEFDEVAIIGAAALHIHEANGITRMGKIFVRQKVVHPLKRWINDRRQRISIFLSQLCRSAGPIDAGKF